MTRGAQRVTQSRPNAQPSQRPRRFNVVRLRCLIAIACLAVAFLGLGGRLVQLAMLGQQDVRVSITRPIATGYSRPDIVDRNGRLLAGDIAMPSLFADPALILDRDEAAEKLTQLFPDLDAARLRASFADRKRRFVWIKRGIAPIVAQRIHNLGLPGLAFRKELRRAYPMGRMAGHVLGRVNIDNKGIDGIELHLDETGRAEPVHSVQPNDGPPVRLTLDTAVQHGLEAELSQTMDRYGAKGAAGVVLDINSGAIVASASLPGIDPGRTRQALDPQRRDKVAGGTFELGSVFKALTFAYGFESGVIDPQSQFDISHALQVDDFKLQDHLKVTRPLSVREAFIRSSNVSAGLIGLSTGTERQKNYLERFGLTGALKTEAGTVASAQLPARWSEAATATVSYGHGIAVAPLQFAASVASILNGGRRVTPTFLMTTADEIEDEDDRVVSAETSQRMRALFRANVADAGGTGRRARVTGYDVGGKTGTAEIASGGGYKKDAVIASFVAAFPISDPKILTFVMLVEPRAERSDPRSINASRNAAPTTAKLIARIAPLLGILPSADVTPVDPSHSAQAVFDGTSLAQ